MRENRTVRTQTLRLLESPMYPESAMLLTYLRARVTFARRDDAGLGAVEWAIIVALAVGIAFIVAGILTGKAQEIARGVRTN